MVGVWNIVGYLEGGSFKAGKFKLCSDVLKFNSKRRDVGARRRWQDLSGRAARQFSNRWEFFFILAGSLKTLGPTGMH
jgi:hypothetical protein